MRFRGLLTLQECARRLFEQGIGYRSPKDGILRPYSKMSMSIFWREAEAEAQAAFVEKAAAVRAFQLDAYLRLHAEAMGAWERSKRGATTYREKTVKVASAAGG